LRLWLDIPALFPRLRGIVADGRKIPVTIKRWGRWGGRRFELGFAWPSLGQWAVAGNSLQLAHQFFRDGVRVAVGEPTGSAAGVIRCEDPISPALVRYSSRARSRRFWPRLGFYDGQGKRLAVMYGACKGQHVVCTNDFPCVAPLVIGELAFRFWSDLHASPPSA
jgi:hypothetical protein